MMKIILIILFLLYNIYLINCAIKIAQLSVFSVAKNQSFCILSCEGKKHTLCEKPKRPDNCTRFRAIEHTSDLEEDYLDGHNGLRNHYAQANKVANMRILLWDEELRLMAANWLNSCPHYEMDPCAMEMKSIRTRVAMNIAFYDLPYFPKYYVAMALRDWYHEKSKTKLETRNITVFVSEVNNFTNMVTAMYSRVGCAGARYDSGFGVACIYFHRHYTVSSLYILGKPCSSCSYISPACSTRYKRLCMTSSATNLIKINSFFFLFIYIITYILD